MFDYNTNWNNGKTWPVCFSLNCSNFDLLNFCNVYCNIWSHQTSRSAFLDTLQKPFLKKFEISDFKSSFYIIWQTIIWQIAVFGNHPYQNLSLNQCNASLCNANIFFSTGQILIRVPQVWKALANFWVALTSWFPIQSFLFEKFRLKILNFEKYSPGAL